MNVCRNCKSSDHTTAQCPTPVKCNLCSSANHCFKDCPQAYSNRVKLSTLRSTVSLSQEDICEITDDDNQAPSPHANQVQQPPSSALQQPNDQPAFDLEEEVQDGAGVMDWSAELSKDDNEVSNSSASTTALVILHQAEHLSSSKIELTLVTLQEAGNRLANVLASIPLQESTADLLFQELEGSTSQRPRITVHPSPGSSASSSVNSQPVMSLSAANLATVSDLTPQISTDQAEEAPLPTQASLLLPITTCWVLDLVGSPTRKCQNESPTSNPFLEQDVVVAFSSTAQIKDMSNAEKAAKPKKKKLIRKKWMSHNLSLN